MAELDVKKAWEKVTWDGAGILKKEQEEAIHHLLLQKDVMCVLKTGFGKSLIYGALCLIKREVSK